MSVRALALRAYYFASFAALGVYLPFFPPWLEARGVVGIGMGLVAATGPAVGIFGPPLFGAFADALGRRSGLLRVASAGTFASFAVIALAGLLGRSLSFGELFVLVLLFATFRSPMNTLADVVAFDVAASGESTYGRLRLWGSLGFLLAAVAGGRLLDARAVAPLPVAIAVAYLGAALAAFALPGPKSPPPRPIAGGVRELLASRDFRLFLATSVLAQLAHSAYDLCYSLHLRDRAFPAEWVGAAWALGVVSEIGLMAAPSRLLDRARPARLLSLALAGAAARWLFIALAHAPAALLAAQPLHALSFGLWWLSSLAFVKGRAPLHALATAQGLFVAATAVGGVVGMLTWAPLYAAAGGGVTFAAAGAVAAAACAGAWLLSISPAPEASSLRER